MKVKCLVCGEIFDDSLEKCPVCGVGKEYFEPVMEEATNNTLDTNDHYVIIGNGTAALNSAIAIRERDKTGSILMIANEPYPTYNRPMLTKALASGIDAKEMAVKDDKWYEDNNIYQILDNAVVKIDTSDKEVLLANNVKFAYDKLIIATGSECFIPPINGKDKPEVIAIRRLSDTNKITKMLDKVKDVVVIGGGVLGLEAAWELKKANCHVTVLEAAPMLMGRQIDANAADMLQMIAKDKGIDIYTNVKITSIDGNDHVEAVSISDGTKFKADLVIVSAGVRANVALAKDINILTDRAIVVNEKMETSIKDIYACGDCAQYDNINYALWSEASEQGKVAGANAANDNISYKTILAPLCFNGMETSLFALGDNGKKADVVYKTIENKDITNRQYEKYYFEDDKLCGVILIGDTSKMAKLTNDLQEHKSYEEFIK